MNTTQALAADQAIVLPAAELRILIMVYCAAILLNILISGLQYWKQREPLQHSLLQYWIAMAVNFIIQGAVANAGLVAVAAGTVGLFFPMLAATRLFAHIFVVPIRPRFTVVSIVLGLLLSVPGFVQGTSFLRMTLPIVVGFSLPVCAVLVDIVRTRETKSVSEWLILVIFSVTTLHGLDYPFLRDVAGTAFWGFSFAFVLFLGLSYIAPIVVHERIARESMAEERRLRREIEAVNEHLSDAYDEMEHTRDLLVQRQKQEALGLLAGGIAHDFNSILSVILGYSERLLGRVDPDLRPEIQMIKSASERAVELVRQIRTFSQPGAAEVSPIQVTDQVHEAVSMVEGLLPPVVKLRTVLDQNAVVESAPGTIHQIVVNLLTNALKALPDSGGEIRVSLEVRPKGSSEGMPDSHEGAVVCIVVQDNGCGIPAEIQEKIWDPFFTTREPGEGTGLGLAVVRRLVEAIGGTIQLQSTLWQGTKVEVCLPASMALPTPAIEQDCAGGAAEKILVVEDEPGVAALYRTILEDYDYDVAMMTDPRKALAVFEEDPQSFDLVVTDMRMPGMDGLALAEQICTIRPDTRIVLISGYSDREVDRAASGANIAAFLEKPVPLATLLDTVRNILDT